MCHVAPCGPPEAVFALAETLGLHVSTYANRPDVLSFRELHFPDEKSINIDVKVHMLYVRKTNDIIHQYITFCKVLTEQIKIHGKPRKAVARGANAGVYTSFANRCISHVCAFVFSS